MTLEWTALGDSAALWVVYSNEPIASAPGEFANPSEWTYCTNIASVAKSSTTGTYILEDPLPNHYKSMRFILSSSDSNLVPLLVSEPYRTIRPPTTIRIR